MTDYYTTPEITEMDVENISLAVSCDCGGGALLEIQD